MSARWGGDDVTLNDGREKQAAVQTGIREQVQEWAGGMDPVDIRDLAKALGAVVRILSQMQKEA